MMVDARTSGAFVGVFGNHVSPQLALAQADQTFKLTNRGKEVAMCSVLITPEFDQDAARAAFEKFKATRSAQPNTRHGGAAAVKALRDGK